MRVHEGKKSLHISQALQSPAIEWFFRVSISYAGHCKIVVERNSETVFHLSSVMTVGAVDI